MDGPGVRQGQEFFNFYNHDFVRVAAAVPSVRVAGPHFNARHIIALIEQAADRKAALVVFPELSLSAYTCDDLFHQRALLDGCLDGLASIVEASKASPILTVVGAPLQIDHLLYNCAVVISNGRILGVVPKTYLPNYREFYEMRYFATGDTSARREIDLLAFRDVPFGSQLIFQAEEQPRLRVHVEICEDVWVPIPPSSWAAMAGATVLLNLSASNTTIGKADYRRHLVLGQSARCMSAYVYTAAGPGESTTDLAWDGHAMIAENGRLLAESERYSFDPQLISSEIDLDYLGVERMRQTSFGQAVLHDKPNLGNFRTVSFSLKLPRQGRLLPSRLYERFPYVPADPLTREDRCREVFHIQVQGLVKRLQSTGIQKVVIGVSGGLDSTHALLVCAQSMDLLGYPRTNILGYTMPGFATTRRTLQQAHSLMKAIGCSAEEIDIRPSCLQMLRDIRHGYSEGVELYDTTFENVQAGERTSHLFRLANLHNALVVGTSDLSELALGWCTYGVGDHMSHYAVNASVPKTLMAYVIRWVAQESTLGAETSGALIAILATKFSPELVPGKAGEEEPSQETEAIIGPYELQDFHLYNILRFGFPPPKVAFLAYCAWHNREVGSWPGVEVQREYGIGDIKKHLTTFVTRFFQFSQFKRSCIPNSPKVGSGGSLSPRGDYRAPSDAEAAPWLEEMDLIPDRE